MTLRPWASMLVCVGVSGSVALAKSYVAVPPVEWSALLPYVRANIVAELEGNEFHVYVCPAHTDRAVVAPFSEELSDFTRVLITEGIRHDGQIEAAIESATERFRARVPTLTDAERTEYRALFWKSMTERPDLMRRLEQHFMTAKSEGRLRCWACEKDPSYAPAARRL